MNWLQFISRRSVRSSLFNTKNLVLFNLQRNLIPKRSLNLTSLNRSQTLSDLSERIDKESILKEEDDSKGFGHVPVLLKEVLEKLKVQPGGVYLDVTFGYGGYTRAILDADPSAIVVALDQDPHAYLRAHKLSQLESYKGRLVPLLGKFGNVLRHLEDFRERASTVGTRYLDPNTVINKFDGVVMDIGVSSGQLDDPSRGFSFMKEGQLDMRMCNFDSNSKEGLSKEFEELTEVDWALHRSLYTSKTLSAYDVVNHFSVDQIAEIISKFGEERFAKVIAKAIEAHRQKNQIETTTQLTNIILSVCPRQARPTYFQGRLSHSMTHPATRTFQSLRIFVNDELGELSRLLDACPSLLKSGGNLVAVTFHSLEDRIVKRFLLSTNHEEKQPSDITGISKKQREAQFKKARRLRHHQKLAAFDRELIIIGNEDDGSFNNEDDGNLDNDHPAALDNFLDETNDNHQSTTFLLPRRRSDALVKPTESEIKVNPRSRSAKLRWATRA